MRITVPHYFDFGPDRRLVGDDLVRPEAWDAIRTETSGPFALPASRAEWEAVAEERADDIGERAKRIDAVLDQRGASSLASYGVGAAFVERWLNLISPDRHLHLGEYAPATVGRLREIFPEAEVHQHDLLADPPLAADWHMFHRIDTEFSNRQWRQIMARFAEHSVIVVAGEMVNLKGAMMELRKPLQNRNLTRSGLVRNRAAFEALWRRTHDAERIELHDSPGWILTPRAGHTSTR